MFSPMYINFDDYPTYNGAIYKVFETNFNAHNQLCYFHPYSTPEGKIITLVNNNSWEILKHSFSKYLTVIKLPKTTVFFLVKNVDDLRQHSNESFW